MVLYNSRYLRRRSWAAMIIAAVVCIVAVAATVVNLTIDALHPAPDSVLQATTASEPENNAVAFTP